jgi:hypothetical protein
MRQRGCHALLWAPLLVRGALIGALELCDPADLDLAPHLPFATTVARLVAHAVGVAATATDVDQRRRTMRELIGLSQEVARATDLQSFVKTVAERRDRDARDYVDIWRVRKPPSALESEQPAKTSTTAARSWT